MTRVLHEILLVSFPKIAGGILTLTLHFVLLRFFTPAEFGVFAVCMNAILLGESLIGSALDMSVLRLAPGYLRDRPERALAVERVALSMKFAIGATLSVGALWFSRWTGEGFFEGLERSDLIVLSSFAVLTMLLLRSVLVHVQVRRRFVAYALTDGLHMLLKFGGAALVLLATDPTPGMLLFVFATAPLVATMFGLANFARLLASRSSSPGAGREVFHYVRWFAATIIVGHTISRLDVLTLGWFAPISEAGLFSGAQVFAMVPPLIGTYAAVVIHPRIVPYCMAGTFRAFFVRAQWVLLLAATAAYLLVLVSWDVVAPRLLPQSFVQSGSILLIMLPSSLLAMAAVPVALGYVMFVRKRFLLSLDFTLLPLLLLLYYLVVPTYGAVGAAWVSTGVGIVRSVAVIAAAWFLIDRAGDLKEPAVLEAAGAETPF